ncbi:MAG: hypothetical protein HY862_07500 [Chloroflexi bacterium]|nr:hypothetical protein [Chloroflexota bacterium]
MNIILLLFTLLGIVGMAYGLRIMIKQSVTLYRRRTGQMREYEGQAAQLIGVGTVAMGLGGVLFGLIGWSGVFYGLVGVTIYFVMLNLADRN